MEIKERFDFDREYEKTRKHNVSESSMSYFSANSSPVSDRFNFGFTYNILPFNHRLEQKGNDNEHTMKMKDEFHNEHYYVGDLVNGYAPKDKATHTGRIVNFIYDHDGVNIRYVYIIDENTREKFALRYNTLQYVNANNRNSQYRKFDYKSIINSKKISESS